MPASHFNSESIKTAGNPGNSPFFKISTHFYIDARGRRRVLCCMEEEGAAAAPLGKSVNYHLTCLGCFSGTRSSCIDPRAFGKLFELTINRIGAQGASIGNGNTVSTDNQNGSRCLLPH
ncbi:hypothetical protein NPIL_586241 [Nephila pilipes]|uniref:Uncharacterized protein n=1 Tax=Nephila pilipes TaxID=299642 RepID=A0A8X6M817_NEPPI|nr:hypothetical protein NPIL_586241 [Nephila pilipes]